MEINITLNDARHAKIDRMEGRLTEVFAEVFNIPHDEASNRVGFIMAFLEDSGLVGELMEDYPVTVDDLERLGFFHPEDNHAPRKLASGSSLLSTLRSLANE